MITDQTDIAVRSVAYVSEKMGLPGIGCETGILFTDKSLMRARLAELGIPQLKNRTVSSVDQAVGFYRELCRERQEKQALSDAAKAQETSNNTRNNTGYNIGDNRGDNSADAAKSETSSALPPVKVIIKPLDTQGSRGVQVCADEQEIRKKYEEASRWSSSREVIVEQFATGREFVVESLVLGYEYRTLCIGDTLYFDIPDAFAAKSRIFPTTADDALRSKVLELDEKIIRGFGLRVGFVHGDAEQDPIAVQRHPRRLLQAGGQIVRRKDQHVALRPFADRKPVFVQKRNHLIRIGAHRPVDADHPDPRAKRP